MLGECSYQRRTAFLESLGARFAGNVPGITVYLLDRWQAQPAGLRWTLDMTPPEGQMVSDRAEAILIECFARTRMGLYKLAVAECAGDVEGAIVRACHEMMDVFGLERYLPEEVPAHG
jgi:hypothetical protein